MKHPAGLYRLYKVGSEEWQDFKEHERADMIAEGWCEVPNSYPVTPEPSDDPDWDKSDDGAPEIAPETPDLSEVSPVIAAEARAAAATAELAELRAAGGDEGVAEGNAGERATSPGPPSEG